MSNEATIGELFEAAIAAERVTEKLYLGLEVKFTHCQEAADFWMRYAKEEEGHARWLERIRNAATPEQLSAPADPFMLEDVRKTTQLSIEHVLAGIKTLEDAYRLVTEVETLETNAVFEFLITHFAEDEKALAFLRTQLKDHMDVAAKFPMRYKSILERQGVKALE